MRIRTFTAATPQAAMANVRAEMGPGAVIIAIDETANGRGVIVRAASDDNAPAGDTANLNPRSIEERLEALLAARLRAPQSPIGRAA